MTFPIYVWGAAQRGIPVQVNALATLVFFVALAIVLVAQFIAWRKRKFLEASMAERDADLKALSMDTLSRS